MQDRAGELLGANQQLVRDIEERNKAAQSLRSAYAEIERMKNRFQAESIHLQQDIDRDVNFGEIIGRSKALEQVFFWVELVAPQDATVLLLGETGTGKGVVARAIHNRSTRREKGAFTGSDARQVRRFELADGGTMLLDEIGEMPMQLEAIEKETRSTLHEYHWPCNVRELENVIERAVIVGLNLSTLRGRMRKFDIRRSYHGSDSLRIRGRPQAHAP